MTDKQQIEEIVKVIESVKLYGADNYARKISHDSVLELAKELLKHYQPKVTEDVVVLTQEELENMVNAKMKCINDMAIIARKKTANEFYNKVNENICSFKLENKSQEFIDGYIQAIADICGRLDQVAKQFGVEVE